MDEDGTARPPGNGPGFRREMSLFDALMIVMGAMIGSGIFIVSADIARTVGSAGLLLLVWLITGVVTVVGALSYGELAGMMPHAGVPVYFVWRALGARAGGRPEVNPKTGDGHRHDAAGARSEPVPFSPAGG
jgi:amino acid transporter